MFVARQSRLCLSLIGILSYAIIWIKYIKKEKKDMMKKKQILSVALSLALMLSMAACSTGGVKTKDTTANETKTEAAAATDKAEDKGEGADEKSTSGRVFVDSCGREVELPENIEKVAVSGPLAQIVMYSFAPDKMVGVAMNWSDAQKKFIPEKYQNMPELGQLYGGREELNLETLISTSPDVVVDIGESKKTIKEDMDKLSEQTNIKFVHIEAKLSDMSEAYTKLGELLNMQADGERYANYCKGKYDRAVALADKLGDAKKGVLYITGDKGLNVMAKTSFHAEPIDLLCDNLAIVNEVSNKGTGNEVDMEQIIKWNPEFIIFAPNSIYDDVKNTDFNQLSAINNDNYAEVPALPYNWMGFPPSVQRILGLMWIGATVYPDMVDYDLKAEVKEYYNMFYHYDLTDEQYEELMYKSH